MKPLTVVLLSISSAAIAAAIVALAIGPGAPASAGSARDPDPAVAGQMAQIARRQEDLARELAALRTELEMRASSDSRAHAENVPALPDKSPAVASASTGRGAVDAAAHPLAGVSASELMDRLEADGMSEEQQMALWTEIRAAGRLDEVLAEYEQRAADDPKNPQAQFVLGAAYLQKIFEVGNGPEAGVWATKADESFDRVLALDQAHWDARFVKAMSLSFWPPIFGKQAEAIEQFEVLVEKQSSQPKDGKFAQTYLLLGNLYQQTGQQAKAFDIWKQGLMQFPDDEDLLGKLDD